MPAAASARLLPTADPESLFLGGPARSQYGFWLDAGPAASAGWSYLGIGVPDAVPDRLPLVPAPHLERPSGHPTGPFAGGWVGWWDYDPAAAAVTGETAPVTTTAASTHRAVRVDRFVAIDHTNGELWAVAPRADLDDFVAIVGDWSRRGAEHSAAPPSAPSLGPATARVDAGVYRQLIEACRAAIRSGDAYQLCLTTQFSITADIDAVDAYRRLRRAHPSHHGGYLRMGERVLLSATPERFLQVESGVIRTHPIKGTRPRGASNAEDDEYVAELRASEKERAENVMIVDLMRNDLQRVCDPGSVVTERLLEVETYPAVHQLVSAVRGRLRAETTLRDVLAATFPAGSMTGAPKRSAIHLLESIEHGPRGTYAGCFGWVGHDGDADLAMVIRSIVLDGRSATVGAGGGITWLSDPAAEVAEVALKAAGPLAAVGATVPADW